MRIGDESVDILGRHELRITYLVKNGLDVLQKGDLVAGAPPEVSAGDVELYWDFAGDTWAFPVYEADVTVIRPAPHSPHGVTRTRATRKAARLI